jgi:hypothetical protein
VRCEVRALRSNSALGAGELWFELLKLFAIGVMRLLLGLSALAWAGWLDMDMDSIA